MASRLNWQIDEDRRLKQLRNEEKIESWNQIAQRLSSQFPICRRTAKQCRERFTNASQFCDNSPEDRNWSSDEDKLLPQLFLQFGSKWTFFTKYYPLKSENSIKNRFYGNIRKTVRKLREIEEVSKSVSHSIKYQMVIRIFQLAHKVQTEGLKLLGSKPDQNLKLFKLRRQLLKISFEEKYPNAEDMVGLAKNLHEMNILFRSLGIYKMKRRGEWELNVKRLSLIYNEAQHNSQCKQERINVPAVQFPQELEKSISSTLISTAQSLDLEEIVQPDLQLEILQNQNWVTNYENQFYKLLSDDFFPFTHELP